MGNVLANIEVSSSFCTLHVKGLLLIKENICQH